VTSAGAPETFDVAGLTVDVAPRGLKAAGNNSPAVVYVVTVRADGGSRPWSSSYGFPPRQASARQAANAALDELDEIARDSRGWLARVTHGMSEEEAEAMEDSPGVTRDVSAAAWVGPYLEPHRAERAARGAWLAAVPPAPPGATG